MILPFKLAWSQTLSLWRAGALRVLLTSLILAVTAVTTVGLFTQRLESALNQQGSLFLGADLTVSSDHPIPDVFELRAKAMDVASVKTYEFASMVVSEDVSQLVEIKAIGQNFPLRGSLSIGDIASKQEKKANTIPQTGEAWIEPKLAALLQLKVGDLVEVGVRKLRITALLIHEPSRGGDMFSFAPRLMMNAVDLPSTQLIQYGSRVKYQLLLASNPKSISQYILQNKPALGRGERMEFASNARPEIKLALDKAHQFLGLSAMVSVILAMVAMLLSCIPFIKLCMDAFALMRCFGAPKKLILQVFLMQIVLISFFSALLGVMLGFFAHLGLVKLAGNLFFEVLSPISWAPILVGFVVSISMMFTVVLPHVWGIRNLTAMNILRRETVTQSIFNALKFFPGAVVMSMMILWQADSLRLAFYIIFALILSFMVIMGIAYGFVKLINSLLDHLTQSQIISAIKFGGYAVKRRFSLSTIQMIGFSMGLTVIISLTIIKNDLIHNWQLALPLDAPNQFVINIQPSQLIGIDQFFRLQSINKPTVYPMVRARLISISGKNTNAIVWKDMRAKHLAEREFNLSWTSVMQSDNTLVSGRWWTPAEKGKPYISIEKDLANTLGIKLRDQLIFEIAGESLKLTVTSLRKVSWDSMHANFFALTPPGVLDQFAASYISSFHLPKGSDKSLNKLVRHYPNLTVIDISSLLEQVRGLINKISNAVSYVYGFSLFAGMTVLYAALLATQEERISEVTILRVFGAPRWYVAVTYVTEFLIIGFVAAFVAIFVSNLLAYYISVNILNIQFQFNVLFSSIILISASFFVPFIAWIGLRRNLNVPPRQLLNSI